jgi:transcriptional regulator with XRE-family HTH domain
MSEKDSKKMIGANLRHLRKLKDMTQNELAEQLEIRRSNIGAYEEGRADPRYDTLEKISGFFNVSLDNLVKRDLTRLSEREINELDSGEAGAKIRPLIIPVDKATGRERIVFIPQKASAGYLNGYADPEYIEDLPRFDLPFLGPGTYRAFEIKGDSMLPLPSGSTVIGEYVENWDSIKEGQTYVVVSSTEGVVYKRVYKRLGEDGKAYLVLRSDNPAYSPFEIEMSDVREMWRARTYFSEQFPEPETPTIDRLTQMVLTLQQEVMKLKDKDAGKE